VGGDFFQILLLPEGGALVAIGDVSGKGMPAAMTVSMLVGSLHTAAESTASPSAVLAAINRRLLGRSSGGFTTCLVLHIDPDGAVIAANAGHIPPFVNGKEMPVESGLPLGLVKDCKCSETAFQLQPEDRLTLMTDGVVEARNMQGDLFGFERAAAIAESSAHAIAEAAKAFGQEDDITVLCLIRQTAGKEPLTQIEPAGWSQASA
jgi:serine phosphatase RsbU (regulator of sigma subunit)